MLAEFLDFLHSVKTSDEVSSGLLEAISVSTGLEDAATSALLAKRDVVVAGSAGVGKTHLLRRLAANEQLKGLGFQWDDGSQRGRVVPAGPFVRVVPDATALGAARRRAMFEKQGPKHVGTIVAINEGPLLTLARENLEPFRGTIDLLHEAQRGINLPRPKLPVVIDAGGVDLIAAGVPGKILATALVSDTVATSRCSCEDPGICPRRRAWKLLESATTRLRLDELLALIPDTEGVDFRSLWDFIEDVTSGGECELNPPSSAWFWRVFYGDSLLSAKLRDSIDPARAAFPNYESRLWYGAWVEVDEQLALRGVTEKMLALDHRPVASGQDLPGRDMLWLKAQLTFLAPDFSPSLLLRDPAERQLRTAIETGDSTLLVETINNYMTYRTISEPQRNALHLWIDLGVEMRTERPRGQVSLAAIPSEELRAARSIAVANHPDESVKVTGPRRFLVHPAGASLSLATDFVHLLRSGRSHRTADRVHTDAEWRLRRFFYDIAAGTVNAHRYHVVSFDFDRMAPDRRRYTIAQGMIQPEA